MVYVVVELMNIILALRVDFKRDVCEENRYWNVLLYKLLGITNVI